MEHNKTLALIQGRNDVNVNLSFVQLVAAGGILCFLQHVKVFLTIKYIHQV